MWTAEVIKRGRTRKWLPENTARDAQAAQALYRRVAEKSLAHWLDGKCKGCSGAGVRVLLGNGICTSCKEIGVAPVYGVAGPELEHVKEMVGELSSIHDSRSGRAGGCCAAVRHECRDDQAEKKRAEVARAMSQSLAESLNQWPMQLDLIAWRTKELRAKYLALVRKGFTEE